jgi:hypothetical protein
MLAGMFEINFLWVVVGILIAGAAVVLWLAFRRKPG